MQHMAPRPSHAQQCPGRSAHTPVPCGRGACTFLDITLHCKTVAHAILHLLAWLEHQWGSVLGSLNRPPRQTAAHTTTGGAEGRACRYMTESE